MQNKLLLNQVVSSLTSVVKTMGIDPRVRDSVPAGKAVLSRVRFPQLSVQVSVHSQITAFAGKTCRHTAQFVFHNINA